MEVCKSDMKDIIRYLTDAGEFYKAHAETLREQDRPRLINKLVKKLKRKSEHHDKDRINH